MKIIAFNFKCQKAKKDFKKPVMIVSMTPDEALQTIRSLSEQMYMKSPNVGRFEHFDKNGVDFSIAVDFTSKP